MRVNEITSLRENVEVRPTQGGFEVWDNATNRRVGLIYPNIDSANAAADRLRTPTSTPSDGSTVGPGSKNPRASQANTTSADGSTVGQKKGSKTDIERIVLRSEPGLKPVKYALVQYDGTPINKTGSVTEFFDDLEKYDPALKAKLKAQADAAKKSAAETYAKNRRSFVARMGKVNFGVWLFASGTQLYDALQMAFMATGQVGEFKQGKMQAFVNYIVPALGDVGAITATFLAQHYGGKIIGRTLMAGKIKTGNFWKAAADRLNGRRKSTRWWQQFTPRKIVGDVLAYIFGAAAGNMVAQYYANQLGLLEEWGMWEFINRDFVPIIADVSGVSEEEVTQSVDVPEKPEDVEVSDEDVDNAIEANENGEVDEVIEQTETTIKKYGDMEKGSDFWK